MDFYALFEISHIRAIQSALEPTADSIWRIRCREYSEKFHTPLHIVINELDPMFIMQQLYESEIHPSIADDPEEVEGLLDILYKIRDPEYTKLSAEALEVLVDTVLNKEIKRHAKKKMPTPQNIQDEILKSELKPKSGSTSFGDLERLETDAESNLSGFTD